MPKYSGNSQFLSEKVPFIWMKPVPLTRNEKKSYIQDVSFLNMVSLFYKSAGPPLNLKS